MKIWKCKFCYKEKESEDHIKMFLCAVCLEKMEEVKKDGGKYNTIQNKSI